MIPHPGYHGMAHTSSFEHPLPSCCTKSCDEEGVSLSWFADADAGAARDEGYCEKQKGALHWQLWWSETWRGALLELLQWRSAKCRDSIGALKKQRGEERGRKEELQREVEVKDRAQLPLFCPLQVLFRKTTP